MSLGGLVLVGGLGAIAYIALSPRPSRPQLTSVRAEQHKSGPLVRAYHEHPGYDVYELRGGQAIGVDTDGDDIRVYLYASTDINEGPLDYCSWRYRQSCQHTPACAEAYDCMTRRRATGRPARAMTPFVAKITTNAASMASATNEAAWRPGMSTSGQDFVAMPVDESVDIVWNNGAALLVTEHHVFVYASSDGTHGDGGDVVCIMHRDADRSECEALGCSGTSESWSDMQEQDRQMFGEPDRNGHY